jgi:hypothetical protein
MKPEHLHSAGNFLVHTLNHSLVQVLTNIIKFALVNMHISIDVRLIMPWAPSEEKNSRSLQCTPLLLTGSVDEKHCEKNMTDI